ncbi:MAG: NUDIX hydrolase [uncultured bacterium]|nr:MAG: NUDIX hydrolase [uncultured bacterium]
MVTKKPDEKSCGVVLFREEKSPKGAQRKYLVLHYPGGHLDFAKGHVEKGEERAEKRTALRELEEETGIKKVEFLPNFRSEIFYTYFKKGKLSYKQVVFFLAKTEEKEVKLSFEHKNFMWLDFKKALKTLTYDNAKNLLKEAEEYLG